MWPPRSWGCDPGRYTRTEDSVLSLASVRRAFCRKGRAGAKAKEEESEKRQTLGGGRGRDRGTSSNHPSARCHEGAKVESRLQLIRITELELQPDITFFGLSTCLLFCGMSSPVLPQVRS